MNCPSLLSFLVNLDCPASACTSASFLINLKLFCLILYILYIILPHVSLFSMRRLLYCARARAFVISNLLIKFKNTALICKESFFYILNAYYIIVINSSTKKKFCLNLFSLSILSVSLSLCLCLCLSLSLSLSLSLPLSLSFFEASLPLHYFIYVASHWTSPYPSLLKSGFRRNVS